MSSAPPLTPFGSALAGALGAVFSNALVYPLDTAKTRLQALPPSSIAALNPPSTTKADSKTTSVSLGSVQNLPAYLIRRLRKFQLLSLLLRILKTEGLGGAFKGFGANMLNTFSQQFAYFFFHTLLRTRLLRRLNLSSLSTSLELLLGALAGAFAQIFTIPVQVIATRQQLHMPSSLSSPQTISQPFSTPSHEESHKSSPSLLETAQEIIAEDGITGLWTGLKPGLVLTVNPAITYGVFERMKSLRLSGERQGGKLSVKEAFWLGVGSKTLATVVTYPYIFAKVRLQAKSTITSSPSASLPSPSSSANSTQNQAPSYASIAAEPPAFGSAVVPTPEHPALPAKQDKKTSGAIPLLKRVYEEEGFMGWYRGLGAQITKAVLCQGILFVSKDQFEGYAHLILLSLAQLQARVLIKNA